MSLFNGEPPTTKIIGTPNLVGTVYDYPGGDPGDPDDDPPDDDPGDDNSSHHSSSTTDTDNKEATKPRSRNFKAKADKYQEALRKFADKYKFPELYGTIWDATTSINIYTALRRTMYNLMLPLLHHSELVPNGACIHPEDAAIVNSLGPGLLQETSDILYEKLNGLTDSDDKSAREVLNIYYISRNGYKALYDLMQRYQEHLQVNPEMWSTPWKPTQTVFEYVGDMIAIRHRKQARSKQKYTDDQMKMELILQSRSLPQFQTISTTILFLVDRFGPTLLKPYPFKKLTRLYDDVDKNYKTQSEDMSSITDTAVHKIELDRLEKLDISKLMRRRIPRTDAQCEICHQYGHSLATDHICYFSGKLFHSLNHIGLLNASCINRERLKIQEENATKFKNYNLPGNVSKFIAEEPQVETMDIDDINVLFAHKVHYLEAPSDFS